LKALLLCGGDGTRLRPFTYTKPKVLLPLVNRPILFHVLDSLAKASIKEIVLIVGKNGSLIRDLLQKDNPWGLKIKFVEQPEPLGLAHAVLIASEALENSPFLMYLGDNVLDEPLLPMLEAFRCEKPDSLVLVRKVSNPRDFGVAVIEGEKVIKVEEKPKIPLSNLALIGIYFFSEEIHQAVRRIKPSWRGELEITDAIQVLIERGKTVHYKKLSSWWKDTGNSAELLEANKYLLKKLVPSQSGEIKKSCISGNLEIMKGSILKNCQVKGPVAIGAGCKITGSILGPYLSVGEGTEIVNCTLNNSIILPGGELKDITLTQSILGERVLISGGAKTRKDPCSLLVGDDSIIKL
jgi:glucose-1-phosphate thymidylyltransferase